jgi:hypothetical protein
MNRVQKFRSVGDMARAAVVVLPGDGFERFARHCARYFALAPRAYPRGVFRFRTIEEAQAARERVTMDSMRESRTRGCTIYCCRKGGGAPPRA